MWASRALATGQAIAHLVRRSPSSTAVLILGPPSGRVSASFLDNNRDMWYLIYIRVRNNRVSSLARQMAGFFRVWQLGRHRPSISIWHALRQSQRYGRLASDVLSVPADRRPARPAPRGGVLKPLRLRVTGARDAGRLDASRDLCYCQTIHRRKECACSLARRLAGSLHVRQHGPSTRRGRLAVATTIKARYVALIRV